jgi:hypothetical protein
VLGGQKLQVKPELCTSPLETAGSNVQFAVSTRISQTPVPLEPGRGFRTYRSGRIPSACQALSAGPGAVPPSGGFNSYAYTPKLERF